MLSKEEKKALKSGKFKEIMAVLSRHIEPWTDSESRKVLNYLLRRVQFDYQMVKILQDRHCNINAPISSYRLGDYLSSYGRLTPRLIHTMSEANYDFKILNETGEHAGFYLAHGALLNGRVISALKAQGVDFNHQNRYGVSAIDTIMDILYKCSYERAVRRISGLFDTREELISLINNHERYHRIERMVREKINSLPAVENKEIGMDCIISENQAAVRILNRLETYLEHEKREEIRREDMMRLIKAKECLKVEDKGKQQINQVVCGHEGIAAMKRSGLMYEKYHER